MGVLRAAPYAHAHSHADAVKQEALVVIRARRGPLRGHCNQHRTLSIALWARGRSAGADYPLRECGGAAGASGANGASGASGIAYVVRRRVRGVALTYQPPRLLERPVHAVHLVVEAARVAQVVAGAVAAPQRRVDGAAVHALAPLREELRHLD